MTNRSLTLRIQLQNQLLLLGMQVINSHHQQSKVVVIAFGRGELHCDLFVATRGNDPHFGVHLVIPGIRDPGLRTHDLATVVHVDQRDVLDLEGVGPLGEHHSRQEMDGFLFHFIPSEICHTREFQLDGSFCLLEHFVFGLSDDFF